MGRKVSGFHPWEEPLLWGWDRGPSEQRLGAEGEAGWSQRARWGEGILLGRETVCVQMGMTLKPRRRPCLGGPQRQRLRDPVMRGQWAGGRRSEREQEGASGSFHFLR